MSAKPKILVVDDEEIMRQLLARSLAGQGFEVLTAENGKAAIPIIESEELALVISDINMPGGDGHFLMGWLKKSKYAKMPFILMTGDLDAIDGAETKGVTILRKPFRRRELGELINKVLGRSPSPE